MLKFLSGVVAVYLSAFLDELLEVARVTQWTGQGGSGAAILGTGHWRIITKEE